MKRMTPQEQRDQDYLEGYGYGLESTMPEAYVNGNTLAWIRGYRDAKSDQELAHSRAVELLQVRPELAKREGGEPA